MKIGAGETAAWTARGEAQAIALLCGALIVYVIAGFFRPFHLYNNGFAAQAIFLVGGPLFLWQYARGRRLVLGRPSLSGMLLAGLLLLGAVSTLLADIPERSAERLKLYYACVLFGASIFLACRDNVRQVVVPFFLVIGAIHAGFLLELMYSIYASEMPRIPRRGVSTNYFSHIRHFGYLGFLAACASTGVVLLGERRAVRWIGVAFGLLALYGLIQFGSRGAFLAWLVFAILLLVLLPGRRRFVLACVAAVAVASLAVFHVDTRHPFPDKKQQSVFTRKAVGEDQWGTTRGRIGIWQDSWAEIVKRPLLGHGPEAYVLSKCCLKGSVQPHNSVVQFLFEFGVLGTGVALAALLALFRRPLRRLYEGWRRGQPDAMLGVLAFLPLSLLVFSLVDGLLYHAIPLLNFSLQLGLLAAASQAAATPVDGGGAGQRPAPV